MRRFTLDVLMEREKWVGYIKEYDGGTIMECHLSAGPQHFSTT